MSKIKDRSNTLDKVNFVQDITSENAANYSGGISLRGTRKVRDGEALVGGVDPDIILFEDANEGGESLAVNAGTNAGISLLRGSLGGFNNSISSFRIFRGEWRFFKNAGYKNGSSQRLGPGVYNLSRSWNDQISSLRRAAP